LTKISSDNRSKNMIMNLVCQENPDSPSRLVDLSGCVR
jgi:hypothetical protein